MFMLHLKNLARKGLNCINQALHNGTPWHYNDEVFIYRGDVTEYLTCEYTFDGERGDPPC